LLLCLPGDARAAESLFPGARLNALTA